MGVDRFPRGVTKSRARELRQRTTPEEQLLWRRLRNRQLGAVFRRQQPLGFYFADFACFEHKLIIELDGSQHADSAYDAVRDADLQARGFRILRFWNNEVRDNLNGVLEQIAEAL